MTTKRTQIRQALVDLLKGLASTGDNVFGSLVYPLQSGQVPAILVGTGVQEPLQHHLGSGRAVMQGMDIRLELVVKKSSTYEEALDDLLDEVNTRLFASLANRTLSGLIQPINEGPVGEPEFDESTDKPVARLPVLLRVSFTV